MPPTRNKKNDLNKIGQYSLNELLVEQAASAIYQATDENSGDPVFLVTLLPEAAEAGELVDRFLRRAETAAQLKHENILPVLDFGMVDKRPYAILPYREGQFLAERPDFLEIPEPTDKNQAIQSLDLVKQLAAALAVAHPTGLIHHDLRPENIFVDGTGKPYLLDLVVPPTPSAVISREEDQLEALDYQSPEQLAGKALSGRSNIFSLGILLYRLLAGHMPLLPVSEWNIFEHKGVAREVPLQEVRPGLAAATYAAIQDSLWQKEWSRYETAADQQKALERAMTAEAEPAPPPSIWLGLANRLRDPDILRIAIPAVVVLLLLLLFLFWARGGSGQNEETLPTPDIVVLPAEEEPTESPEPTVTEAEVEQILEAELLPTATEIPPTPTKIPTQTAVPPTATEPPPTKTATATLQATEPPTATPTTEPTEVTSCVPSPPFGWELYTIQANDSLSAIGQATNTTVEQLREVNCIVGNLLSVGQQIWVPFSPNPTSTPTPTAAAATTEPGTATPQPPGPPGPPPGPNPTAEPPTPTVKPPDTTP